MKQSSQVDPDEQSSLAAIGSTIRAARQRRGWAVLTLSERAGVSFGLISNLERGRGNPSYKALRRLAQVLEIPLGRLLMSSSRDAGMVRAPERSLLPTEEDVPEHLQAIRELLTPVSSVSLQLIRSTLPPGFSNEGRPFRHLGSEVVTVERGRLLVVHGERRLELDEGDSFTYGCSTPHWWANASTQVTVVLGAVTPFEG